MHEALRILESDEGAFILAGGTDVLVKMKQRVMEPRTLVNIKRIRALSFIEDGPTSLRIGATTRIIDIERSKVVEERFPVLCEALSVIGSIQIRTMATLGGNICNASPAADGIVALVALGTSVETVSSKGPKTFELEDFFEGPGKTVLLRGELLRQMTIPHLPKDSGMAFMRITRTDMDVAKANVAVVLQVSKNVVSDARIALGAVAPTPIRASRAEAGLVGRELTRSAIDEAAGAASEEAKPITDVRSTAEYRKRLVRVLVARCLALAKTRAVVVQP